MLYWPPPSANGLKSMIFLENFRCLILNVGTRIIYIHTVLEGFAYPSETTYADFACFSGTSHLKWRHDLDSLFESGSWRQTSRQSCVMTQLHERGLELAKQTMLSWYLVSVTALSHRQLFTLCSFARFLLQSRLTSFPLICCIVLLWQLPGCSKSRANLHCKTATDQRETPTFWRHDPVHFMRPLLSGGRHATWSCTMYAVAVLCHLLPDKNSTSDSV